jgi:hypothetical protein
MVRFSVFSKRQGVDSKDLPIVYDDSGKPKKAPMVELGTLGALSLSVFSSVSIVVCNKFLISTLGFNYATTLTCAHLAVTGLFLHFARYMKMFEYKTLEFRPLIIFSVLNGASIGFLNLSLGYNSVGFYQMTKLAIIPCTVCLQITFYAKKFSPAVKASLGVRCPTPNDPRITLHTNREHCRPLFSLHFGRTPCRSCSRFPRNTYSNVYTNLC